MPVCDVYLGYKSLVVDVIHLLGVVEKETAKTKTLRVWTGVFHKGSLDEYHYQSYMLGMVMGLEYEFVFRQISSFPIDLGSYTTLY
jgi:hypothetical protein